MLKKITVWLGAVLLSVLCMYIFLQLLNTDILSSLIPSWETTLYPAEYIMVLITLVLLTFSVIIVKVAKKTSHRIKKIKEKEEARRKGYRAKL